MQRQGPTWLAVHVKAVFDLHHEASNLFQVRLNQKRSIHSDFGHKQAIRFENHTQIGQKGIGQKGSRIHGH